VAVEYLNVTANVMRSIQHSKFDFIAFHSEKDMFTDPEGSKALYAKSCAKSKTLTLLDSMWHYLTHEDGAAQLHSAACMRSGTRQGTGLSGFLGCSGGRVDSVACYSVGTGNMNVLQGAISWMNERGVAESNQA
jgi:hypothetical protein